jgi:hypothetical protein
MEVVLICLVFLNVLGILAYMIESASDARPVEDA